MFNFVKNTFSQLGWGKKYQEDNMSWQTGTTSFDRKHPSPPRPKQTPNFARGNFNLGNFKAY